MLYGKRSQGHSGRTRNEWYERDACVTGTSSKGRGETSAKAIKTVTSVLDFEVNYEKGEAITGTEICSPIPTDDLLAAIEAAGYSRSLRRWLDQFGYGTRCMSWLKDE